MKKMLLAFLLVSMVVTTLPHMQTYAAENATSDNTTSVSSKYKGTFYPGGKYSECSWEMNIKGVSGNKIKITFWGGTSSTTLETTVKTTVKKNKASFKFHDNWDNSGKGTITLNKNGTIKVTLTTTNMGDGARASFNWKNVVFSKTDKSTTVYCTGATLTSKFSKKNGKLTISTESFASAKLGDLYGGIFESPGFEPISKKKMTYTLDSKCVWGQTYIGESYKTKGTKISYSGVKNLIKSAKEEEWEFSLLIYVKENKIVKILVVFS